MTNCKTVGKHITWLIWKSVLPTAHYCQLDRLFMSWYQPTYKTIEFDCMNIWLLFVSIQVQLAKLQGCHVIGTCSSQEKTEYLKVKKIFHTISGFSHHICKNKENILSALN